MASEERDLVRGLRRREEEAVVRLVTEYAPCIARWARQHVRDATEVEDLVQDVLFQAWCAAPRLRPDTSLKAWLRTITRNTCRQRMRRWARKPAWPTASVPNGEAVANGHGYENPSEAERRIDVENALGRLPDREARVLRMLYIEDRSIREAAGLLGVSPPATKSLAARARRRFRSVCHDWVDVLSAWSVPLVPFLTQPPRPVPDGMVKTGVATAVAAVLVVGGSISPSGSPGDGDGGTATAPKKASEPRSEDLERSRSPGHLGREVLLGGRGVAEVDPSGDALPGHDGAERARGVWRAQGDETAIGGPAAFAGGDAHADGPTTLEEGDRKGGDREDPGSRDAGTTERAPSAEARGGVSARADADEGEGEDADDTSRAVPAFQGGESDA